MYIETGAGTFFNVPSDWRCSMSGWVEKVFPPSIEKVTVEPCSPEALPGTSAVPVGMCPTALYSRASPSPSFDETIC